MIFYHYILSLFVLIFFAQLFSSLSFLVIIFFADISHPNLYMFFNKTARSCTPTGTDWLEVFFNIFISKSWATCVLPSDNETLPFWLHFGRAAEIRIHRRTVHLIYLFKPSNFISTHVMPLDSTKADGVVAVLYFSSTLSSRTAFYL